MIFCPAPANPFPEFIERYWKACRNVCPKLVGLCGKWDFEDLIPGLSDFDTRLIFRDDMTPADWALTSLAVGRVHTELTKEKPEWRRILEHLPGINLTTSELNDSLCYLPETHLWTAYRGEIRPAWESHWGSSDEYFYLRKFAAYFGPYQRGIDPAINLGPYESKYALHSRYMHYFAPPVQAAVALMIRAPERGKRRALLQARALFPHAATIDRVIDAVDRHYECVADYEEPELTHIERTLETYLNSVLQVLQNSVGGLRAGLPTTPERLRAEVSRRTGSPVSRLFELLCFSRLMRGRLLFFAESIPWFETDWLIRNELRRISPWFYSEALECYGRARFQESISAEQALERAAGAVIAPTVVDEYKSFAELASQPVEIGDEKNTARRVSERFEAVQLALEALMQNLRRHVTEECQSHCHVQH